MGIENIKNVVIYGIGTRFQNCFIKDRLLPDGFARYNIEIIGFADGNYSNAGGGIYYAEKEYAVNSIDELTKNYDALIITSRRYFEQIKDELTSRSHKANKIYLLDEFITPFMEEIYGVELYRGKQGIEVGGPSDIFSCVYDRCSFCDGVNYSGETIWWESDDRKEYCYKEKTIGKMYIAEATDMNMIPAGKYDFLLSSNNLEHIANPLKALSEFCRIIRRGGHIFLAVPMKERTFDHNRTYTSFEHILSDYENNVEENDMTHLPEIIEKHDYTMDVLCGGRETFIKRAEKNIENRCLHHHVFDESCLKEMFRYVGLKVVKFQEALNNYIIIGEK